MTEPDDIVLEEFQRKSEIVLTASDSLDLRASIVLILATFLGAETAKLFDKSHAGITLLLELLAGVSLAASLAAAIVSLWPREYRYPEPTGVNERVRFLRALCQDQRLAGNESLREQMVTRQIQQDRLLTLTENTSHNQAQNLKKNGWLNASFYLTTVALILFLAVSGLIYFAAERKP